MDVERKELRNGLVVATEAMPQVRSVAIGVWVKGGSRRETDAAIGLAHFIEHLLFKGTRSRSAARIAEIIDSIGGQLNAFTDKEYVGYYAKVLDEHLPEAFELLADIVLNPTFPSVEVERERNVIFEEIAMVEDSPQDLIQEMFLARFWHGHPLGRPIAGTKESVGRIARRDVQAFFRANYTAGSTIVAVAGNIRHRRVQELARRYFGDLTRGDPAAPEVPPEVRAAREVRRKPNLEQTHLCLGTVCPPVTHPDRYAAHVLNTILGGGMSSRLFQNIRERRGLVYSIYSSLSLYRDAGTLVVYAGMGRRNAGRVVELTCRELRALKRNRAQAQPGSPIRAGAGQGEPTGLDRARAGELEQPHDAPGAAGDLLRSVRRSRRDPAQRGAGTGARRAPAGQRAFRRAFPDPDLAGER
jgi:predicted Zn-dependent peptidase